MTPILAALVLAAPSPSAPSWECLPWRCIGPFRGGRTVGACGVRSQPFTFYIGVNNGGVWKTDDAGRTWEPIFDRESTGSIGDVMVAPSNPNILYVGSGEGLQRPDLSTGNGMYRSDDAGKTWRHLGLEGAQQIGGIDVDRRNPDRVFVAALGHPYGPNEERGVYRTLDGGKSWKKVLYLDADTGAVQVAIDPNRPNVVYADLWEARQGPWENGRWQGPGSGLYKSVDGGESWRKLTQGLPTFEQGLGRIGFTIAPSDSRVLYATVDARALGGLYKSIDSGETWARVNDERRLISRGDDFAEVKVHPKNPNVVFVGDTSYYRSDDGGKNFVCIKGSPGGDDYHRAWINPDNPEIMLLAADQGACVTLNGGRTWSSWYNQPTAQLYHVAVDDQFPYWVYGGQQESGSVAIASRGDYGQITFRDWHPSGGDEYCYLAPDPLNPRYVYGGRINRFDKFTGEVVDIRPKAQYRVLRTAPSLFSPVNPKKLYFAGNFLFQTVDGGQNWTAISPDLSRAQPEIPANVGKYRTPDLATMPRRGVIYTVAPSYRTEDVIWCGTDDGLIHVTRDGGKTWKDVTPPGLTAWSKVSLMDAGRFDDRTAYAAINRIRLDDQSPWIYKTHDGGATWTKIVGGLPPGPINVVREDPRVPGLLYCGSETHVSVSFDDGSNWHSLRNNMPASSVRDLVVKNDDLVVGTHGRSIWILDGVSLLRAIAQAGGRGSQPILASPSVAWQVERNRNDNTPLPPDEPLGKNPPDGAPIDYWLPIGASRVEVEILAADGSTIRKWTSADPRPALDPKSITVMPGWARPPQTVGKTAGSHRLVWDLRLPRPASDRESLPISAIWNDTPLYPLGAWASPGAYTVRLTVDGSVLTKPLDVRPDPR